MRRRAFLSTAGVGVAMSTLARPALSQGRMEWRMVTAWSKDMPGPGSGAERFARRVGEMSDGRLTIRVHPAGDLVPALQGFDAVANGTAEMSHGTAHHHANKSKAFAFFTAAPFGLTAEEHLAWLRYGGGQRLWDALCEPFAIRPFLCGASGPRPAGWFRRDIRKADDLKGLKIAAGGLGAMMLERLGAKPVQIAPGDVAGALSAKTVDAAESFGPVIDLAFELPKSARFCFWPGVHEPSAAFELLVSKPKFDALPADLRAILDNAANVENAEVAAELDARSGPAFAALGKLANVAVRPMPHDVLIAQGQAAGSLMRDLAEDPDPQVKQVAQVYVAQRRALGAWTRAGDLGFINARALKYAYP